jgi:two-component system nitrogen regulation sensor histidine kinase NtrY
VTFRTKLVVAFTLIVLGATGLLAWGVTQFARQQYEVSARERSEALAAQFQREFALRGEEVSNRVQDIADAEGTVRMALELGRPQADSSAYAGDARGLAATHRLDFLELVANDVLISSAQYPAQIGNKEDWLAAQSNWNQVPPFLRSVDLPDGPQLALVSVRQVRAGASNLYLIGGRRVDADFLRTFVPAPGMRVLLSSNLQESFNPAAMLSAEGAVPRAELFAPLLASAASQTGTSEGAIHWGDDSSSVEHFLVVPLLGRKSEVLGVLLIGSEEKEYAILATRVRALALIVAAAATLLGIFLGWWVSARLTRPLARLETEARRIASGGLAASRPAGAPGVVAGRGASAAAHSARPRDEVARVSRAFSAMALTLSEQSRRAQEEERVAAWREITRRLTHEMKERLFPLQVAVENLRRSRDQGSGASGESFVDSLATLNAELEKLKATVARFSNFAKMPAPRLQPVNVNEAVRAAIRAFEPQFSAVGRPPVTPDLFLNERLDHIAADPLLLSKALESLLYRSLDSMPAGGTLVIRTAQDAGFVRIEIADTGVGLTSDERARLFTPYYAAGAHGSGLGLAIAQCVVTAHGGKLSAESTAGMGTTYRIEFPGAPRIPDPGMLVETIEVTEDRRAASPRQDAPVHPEREPEVATTSKIS